MEVIIKGQLMDVTSKSYEFEGQKGVSHKACIYSNEKLYNVVIPMERVEEFKSLIGNKIEINCTIFIKGSYNLRLINE